MFEAERETEKRRSPRTGCPGAQPCEHGERQDRQGEKLQWREAQDGKRPGDLAFAWTVVRTLSERRLRYASAIEVEGIGRAAFALVANCSPYTYAGRLGLRFAPDATFEGGLDVVAPVEVRARAIPRLTVQALRGRPGGGVTLVGHDLDRIVIRCDEAMPAQVDGEDIGDLLEAEIVAVREILTVIT